MFGCVKKQEVADKPLAKREYKVVYKKTNVNIQRTVIKLIDMEGRAFETAVYGRRDEQYVDTGEDARIHCDNKHVSEMREPKVSEVNIRTSLEIVKNTLKDYVGTQGHTSLMDDPEKPTKAIAGPFKSAEIGATTDYMQVFDVASVVKKCDCND